MSKLQLNELKAPSTGATIGTEHLINGTAKSQCNFNGIGIVSIDSSFNVSSITDRGIGAYTFALTNSMSDLNYTFSGNSRYGGMPGGRGYILSSQDIDSGSIAVSSYVTSSLGVADTPENSRVLHGDLA